jgi:integrase
MSNKRIRVGEGIYLRADVQGVLTYYITYMNNTRKLRWERVGKKNDGITKQFCKQLRSKRINQRMHGEDVSSQRAKEIVLFDDLAQDHFEIVKATYKDQIGPMKRYEYHIKPHIGYKNINDITKFDIENITKTMLSKGLKPATVDRTRQTISAIFNLGVYHEKCKENPASISRSDQVSIMRRNKKNINNGRERYLSKVEAETLLHELRIRSENVYLMALIALTTGARSGEILSIKFKDIDYFSGFITLNETKNGYSRKIKITPKVEALLKNRQQEKPNHYLFQTSSNNKLSKIPSVYVAVANNIFNKDLEGDDSKNRVVFHTLRHTFASWLALNDVPIFTIQKLMGHRDINMTMRYAKLSPEAGIDAVMNIERNLVG